MKKTANNPKEAAPCQAKAPAPKTIDTATVDELHAAAHKTLMAINRLRAEYDALNKELAKRLQAKG